jgi:hypothetical protein
MAHTAISHLKSVDLRESRRKTASWADPIEALFGSLPQFSVAALLLLGGVALLFA